MVLAPLASLVVNPHMYRTVGYDTFKDLAPVAEVADLPILLVVNPSLPVHNVAELIAYAKANPDKLSHPSSGQRHAVASRHGSVQAGAPASPFCTCPIAAACQRWST